MLASSVSAACQRQIPVAAEMPYGDSGHVLFLAPCCIFLVMSQNFMLTCLLHAVGLIPGDMELSPGFCGEQDGELCALNLNSSVHSSLQAKSMHVPVLSPGQRKQQRW
jgi:hypothetical protein